MTSLPTSIETYLREAGFSSTELLVLKRLIEGKAMTLRELASKTGKSVGVLDQATKKLSEKGILTRDIVNSTPKICLASVDAVKAWVERDMQDKKKVLDRKQQDFEAFLATIEHQKDRPEIEYFEGDEGITQAYRRLLESDEHWYVYDPCDEKEEENSLREFRVQMFRDRRRRKIVAKVLAPDTAMGRRYKSRDVFEYRETHLVDPDTFPVAFEKVIVGDTIACINHEKKKACFIRYPDFAHTDRKVFSMYWKHGEERQEREVENETKNEQKNEGVDIKTSFVSVLRECFLSKKALSFSLVCVVVSLTCTYGMYTYTFELMKDEVGNRLMSIVATAAPDFNPTDLEKLHFARDMRTEEYQRVYRKLNKIRDSNEDIWYAYIMRPADAMGQYVFVADADSNYFLPDPNNADGVEVVSPGTHYSEFFLGEYYRENVMKKPVAEKVIVTDQWGTYLSGAAPIFDTNGNAVAFLGVDMNISDFTDKLDKRFKPILCFMAVVLFLFLARIIFLVLQSSSYLSLRDSHKA